VGLVEVQGRRLTSLDEVLETERSHKHRGAAWMAADDYRQLARPESAESHGLLQFANFRGVLGPESGCYVLANGVGLRIEPSEQSDKGGVIHEFGLPTMRPAYAPPRRVICTVDRHGRP
jgi:hypothetical protein